MIKLLLTLALAALPAYSQFTNAKSIWNRPITSTAPTDGYAIVWNASQGKFIFAANGGSNPGTTIPYTVNHTVAGTDCGNLLTYNGSSLTATLANPPTSNTCQIVIENLNASTLTISRNGLTINGLSSNLTLAQYGWLTIWTDGTNYFTSQVLSPAATSFPTDTKVVVSTATGQAVGWTSVQMTTADFVKNTPATSVVSPGPSFALASGRTYFFRIKVMITTDVNATGYQMYPQFSGSASNYSDSYVSFAPGLTPVMANDVYNGSGFGGPNPTSSTSYLLLYEGTITTTGAGNLTIGINRVAGSGTTTVKAGSTMECWPLF
jgi:hypothetical protein